MSQPGSMISQPDSNAIIFLQLRWKLDTLSRIGTLTEVVGASRHAEAAASDVDTSPPWRERGSLAPLALQA